MRIVVKDHESKMAIRLHLPIRMICSKSAIRIARKAAGSSIPSWLTPELADGLRKALKQYVREHGHFNLVEINSADGDYVRIRV